eukprot:13996044-Alexandrium_andersonii.AAC.1
MYSSGGTPGAPAGALRSSQPLSAKKSDVRPVDDVGQGVRGLANELLPELAVRYEATREHEPQRG